MVADKEQMMRLLRESILQLCRVSLMGSFEVDGIICISPTGGRGGGGGGDGRGDCDNDGQFVVKVHERVNDNERLENDDDDGSSDGDGDATTEVGATGNGVDVGVANTNGTMMTTMKKFKIETNVVATRSFDRRVRSRGGRANPNRNGGICRYSGIGSTNRTGVRRIEDSFYFSCERCSVAFATRPALDGHAEKCTGVADVCRSAAASRKRKQNLRTGAVDAPGHDDGERATGVKQQQHHHHGTSLQSGTSQRCSNGDGDERAYVPEMSTSLIDRRLITGLVYFCERCKVNYPDLATYRRHGMTLHGEYACDLCPERFASGTALAAHVDVQHANERKAFDCALCGVAFASVLELRGHRLEVHCLPMEVGADAGGGEAKVVIGDLEDDDDDAESEDDIAWTNGGGNGDDAPKDFCDRLRSVDFASCNRVFPTRKDNRDRSRSGVVVGMKIAPAPLDRGGADGGNGFAPDDQLPYECDKCRDVVHGAAAYQAHCKRTHRRTPCLHCGKTFSQKGNMERHLRLHAGTKPYRCHLCRRSFSHDKALRGHVGQDHSMTALQDLLL